MERVEDRTHEIRGETFKDDPFVPGGYDDSSDAAPAALDRDAVARDVGAVALDGAGAYVVPTEVTDVGRVALEGADVAPPESADVGRAALEGAGAGSSADVASRPTIEDLG